MKPQFSYRFLWYVFLKPPSPRAVFLFLPRLPCRIKKCVPRERGTHFSSLFRKSNAIDRPGKAVPGKHIGDEKRQHNQRRQITAQPNRQHSGGKADQHHRVQQIHRQGIASHALQHSQAPAGSQNQENPNPHQRQQPHTQARKPGKPVCSITFCAIKPRCRQSPMKQNQPRAQCRGQENRRRSAQRRPCPAKAAQQMPAALIITQQKMLMCDKVAHKNLIDDSPLFRKTQDIITCPALCFCFQID